MPLTNQSCRDSLANSWLQPISFSVFTGKGTGCSVLNGRSVLNAFLPTSLSFDWQRPVCCTVPNSWLQPISFSVFTGKGTGCSVLNGRSVLNAFLPTSLSFDWQRPVCCTVPISLIFTGKKPGLSHHHRHHGLWCVLSLRPAHSYEKGSNVQSLLYTQTAHMTMHTMRLTISCTNAYCLTLL